MGYNLNIDKKHKSINDTVDLQFKALKKALGREIFTTFEIWVKDDETGEIDYYTARKLYNNIISNDIFVKLKYRLAMSGVIAINELICNEYSKILELESENDDLKRELIFYKGLVEERKTNISY